MKYLFKIVILSFIGFISPLVILLGFANKFLNVPLFEIAEIREPILDSAISQIDPNQQNLNQTENTTNLLNVKSDQTLDPSTDSYFLASAYFSMSTPPRVGKRQKLISKYQDDATAKGWAIALKRNSTSIRPEVYWKGEDAKSGGWYTFDNFNIKRNRWYSLTLVAKSKDLIALYVEEMPNALPSEDEEQVRDLVSQGPVFLGGFSVSDVDFENTASPLEFPTTSIESSEFKGELRNVIIANTDSELNSQKKVINLIAGGADNLVQALDTKQVALRVGEDGKDKSQYKRVVASKVQNS
ncbi:MAG: hypothetical protein KBC84_09015 [Proteobacteria bacterium]|nr:hypothetical protein [Pseudomonadota bacterium]